MEKVSNCKRPLSCHLLLLHQVADTNLVIHSGYTVCLCIPDISTVYRVEYAQTFMHYVQLTIPVYVYISLFNSKISLLLLFFYLLPANCMFIM